MAILATLIPDERGVCDCYAYGTYGGGIIPRGAGGLLDVPSVWPDRDPPSPSLWAYEASIIAMTGGFPD